MSPRPLDATVLSGALDLRLQKSRISCDQSARKVRKPLKDVLAQKTVLERDMKRRNASEAQDREVRSQGKHTWFLQGQLFDQLYHDKHAEELAEQWEVEETRKHERRTKPCAVPHAEWLNLTQRRAEAMPTEDKSVAWLASMTDIL